MTVRIEITQTRSLEEGPLYRVLTRTVYAEGIAAEIFVFDTETEEFSHVAVSFDMQEFPVGKTQAQADGKAYYRAIEAQVDYTVASTAQAAAVYTKLRVRQLTGEYAAVNSGFVGSDTTSYTGGS
jgi:hypothetical protein